MFNSNIAQSKVFEIVLSVHNSQEQDTQTLTAAFPFPPSPEDIQQWLSGWISCGYSLSSTPQLIRTL